MEFVRLEKRGHIALLKLNRPKALNALNTAMLNEIEMAAAKVERDPEVRVLIISGEGKAFGAGADIGEMVGLSRAEAKAFADAGHRAFKRIDDLYIPVIAAIHGYALGGGLELAPKLPSSVNLKLDLVSPLVSEGHKGFRAWWEHPTP